MGLHLQRVRQALGLVPDGPQRGLDVPNPVLPLLHQGGLRLGHALPQLVHRRVHGAEGLLEVAAQALARTRQLVLELGGVGLGGVHHVLLLLLHVRPALLDLPQGLLQHLVQPLLVSIAVLLRLLKNRRGAGDLLREVKQQLLLIVLEHPVPAPDVAGQP